MGLKEVVGDKGLEEATVRWGKTLFSHAAEGGRLWDKGFWDNRLIGLALSDERFKVSLFQFVDLLPTLQTPKQLAGHFKAYFGGRGSGLHGVLKAGAEALGMSDWASAKAAELMRDNIRGLAGRFIVGESPQAAWPVLERLWGQGLSATLDLVGEKAVSGVEAARFQQAYLNLLEQGSRQMGQWPAHRLEGERPRLNVSVKLSALYARPKPHDWEGTAQAIKEALRPIMLAAKQVGAFVNLDAEDYRTQEMTHKVFLELVREPELAGYPHFGLVVQAYLLDAEQTLAGLLAFFQECATPYTIRLVKGAYWDYETVVARQKGWPLPVHTEKWATDAAFEHCLAILLAAHGHARAAVATHNLRSMARALALAEAMNVPREAWEFQMLYGMAPPLERALLKLEQPLCLYAPVGDLLQGMAYFVRRLLENTSNESFLRQGFAGQAGWEELLKPPAPPSEIPSPPPVDERPFVNLPPLDFTLDANRRAMGQALAGLKASLPLEALPLVGGRRRATGRKLESHNPADPDTLVAQIEAVEREEAQEALQIAYGYQPEWRATPVAGRVKALRQAAQQMEAQRFDLCALMVLETGKTWPEADADLAEAVDFLNYYALSMERLAGAHLTQPVAGEDNRLIYEPLGVGLVIAPWNFPLSISTGMTAAALVAGNTVLYKPAETSSMVGAKMVSILHKAGIPKEALAFLPGYGEEVGAWLASQPQTAFIAFTGSLEVGLQLVETAGRTPTGQERVKRVMAEMGGKNAIIVDEDADLDEAVRAIIQSAFGYSGQKCSAASRVIALEGVYDRLCERLAPAVEELRVGPPEEPGSDLGPLIDRVALQKVRRYVRLGESEGQVLARGRIPDGPGHWMAPVVFTGLWSDSRVCQDEIFGPVVALMRARDFTQALKLANDSPYKLTGGLFSRNPDHISRARQEFRVGNLYINRAITGALVERQPFGGLGLSGTGFKAGGADYLLQFLTARVVTENTLRQGFAPKPPVEEPP